jgi:hypothetical protein
MMRRNSGRARSRRQGKLAAIGLAAGLAVPGAFLAATPATVGAAPANPLGPVVTQLQGFYAQALINASVTLFEVEFLVADATNLSCLLDPGPDPYCL